MGVAGAGLDLLADIEDVHLGALARPQAERKLVAQRGSAPGFEEGDVARRLGREIPREEKIIVWKIEGQVQREWYGTECGEQRLVRLFDLKTERQCAGDGQIEERIGVHAVACGKDQSQDKRGTGIYDVK